MRGVGYEPHKAAEFAAYLVSKSGGSMEVLKLSKMLYIGERTSIEKFGYPIFCDAWFSVKDGPICNNALNGVDGAQDRKVWSPLLRREGNVVHLVRPFTDDDCIHISLADMAIGDKIIADYGRLTSSQIRARTHEFPEYSNPPGLARGSTDPKRVRITDRDIAHGIGLEDADGVAEAIAEIRRLHEDNPFG